MIIKKTKNKFKTYQYFLFLVCLFFINQVNGKILKDDVLSIGEEEFSYSYVCNKVLKKESPLIEVENILTLDCMSRKVKVYDFCSKELADSPYYIRGIVDAKKKKVICKKGKKVTMKVACLKADLDCKDPELACYKLKLKYAYRLDLDHSSSFKENDQKVLNCHFSVKKSITLPK